MKVIQSIRFALITTLSFTAVFFGGTAVVEAMNQPDELSPQASAAMCVEGQKPADIRAERLDAYFVKRDMPLHGYGDELVAAADSCGLDWRLVAAIGVRESSGGKHLMNNNPFGWGSAKIPFKDFSEAITVVTDNLCGKNPNTARYYKDTSVDKKLWYYNGSVEPTYPGEVKAIMAMF